MDTKVKKEAGITLIVLVITVVVLMILAGFTLSLSIGQGGIFRNANKMDFLEDISNLKKDIDETQVVAKTNGQSNEKVLNTLQEKLDKWEQENKKYENLQFELVLDEDNNYVLTYIDGATKNQEEWLKSVSFPGV